LVVISGACYWASIQLTSTFIIAVKIGRSRHGHYQGFVALMKNAAVVMFRCWRAVTVWCVVYIGMYSDSRIVVRERCLNMAGTVLVQLCCRYLTAICRNDLTMVTRAYPIYWEVDWVFQQLDLRT